MGSIRYESPQTHKSSKYYSEIVSKNLPPDQQKLKDFECHLIEDHSDLPIIFIFISHSHRKQRLAVPVSTPEREPGLRFDTFGNSLKREQARSMISLSLTPPLISIPTHYPCPNRLNISPDRASSLLLTITLIASIIHPTVPPACF